MPFPIITAIPVVVAAIARIAASAVAYSFVNGVVAEEFAMYMSKNKEAVDLIKSGIDDFAIKTAADIAGIELDRDKPLSDASLCHAITKKTGVTIRTLKNRQSIDQDIEYFAIAKIEQGSGIRFRNLRDKNMIKEDVLKEATKYISEATGIPLTDLSNANSTREECKEYATISALAYVSENLDLAKQMCSGIDFEGIRDGIKEAAGIDPTTGECILTDDNEISDEAIVLAVIELTILSVSEKYAISSKRKMSVIKRQARRRAASASFRAAHGTRNQYNKVTN